MTKYILTLAVVLALSSQSAEASALDKVKAVGSFTKRVVLFLPRLALIHTGTLVITVPMAWYYDEFNSLGSH